MKFLDIIIETKKTCTTYLPFEQSLKDMFQYSFKRFLEYYNIPLKDIKERYTDKFDGVEERMMFRIELYKEGWDIEQIERYIYKYLLKQPFPNLDIEFYKCIYNNIIVKNEIYKKEKEKRTGRPSLPKSIKEYIKNKVKNKTKQDMRKRYEYSNKYEKIKDNFLTLEDINKLEKEVSDKTILEKLKYFTIQKNLS